MFDYMQLTDKHSVNENDEVSIRELANSIVKVMNYPGKPNVCISSHYF
jgi:hypothetical protein